MELIKNTEKIQNTGKKLSKEQKKFNDLIKKIEQEKESLKTWNLTVLACKDKYFSEFFPLLEKYTDQQVALVLKFDQALARFKFSRKEQKYLSEMVLSLIRNILKATKNPDYLDQMKSLHEEYENTCMQYRTKAEQRFFQMMELEAEVLEDFFKGGESSEFEHKFENLKDEPKPAPKSKKQLQQAQEELNASRAVKDIFRKLAKDLHPDREQDPTERERKHELMQRANAAYDKKDLLGLLGLQLEIEQIRPEAIDSVAEDQLKHYNRVLKEQLEELEMEVNDLKYSLQEFGLLVQEPHRLKNQEAGSEVLLKNLDKEIKALKKSIREIKQDLESFNQAENIKTMLKVVEAQALEAARDQEDELGLEW